MVFQCCPITNGTFGTRSHHRIQLTTPDGKPLQLPSDNWHKLIRSKDAKFVPGLVHVRLSAAPRGLYVPSRPTPLLSHLHSPAALYAHDSIARQWVYPSLSSEYVCYLMSHVRACDNNRGSLLLTSDRIIFVGDSPGHVYGCPFAVASLSKLVVALPVCAVKTVSVVEDKRAEMNWKVVVTTNDFRQLQVSVEPGTRMSATWTRAGHELNKLQEVQATDAKRFLTNFMNEISWMKAEKTAMMPTGHDSPWQRPILFSSTHSVKDLVDEPVPTSTSPKHTALASPPELLSDSHESSPPPPAFEDVDSPSRGAPSPPSFDEAMPALSAPSDASDADSPRVPERGALSPRAGREAFPAPVDSPRTPSGSGNPPGVDTEPADAPSPPFTVNTALNRASSCSTAQSEDTTTMDASTSSLPQESYSFDIEMEYKRILENIQGDVVAREWMVFNHNDYNVCPTYPQHLLMPKRFFDWPKQPAGMCDT